MQHTLTFTAGNKKYVSKPFDFETMCMVNDANSIEGKGMLSMCKDAVDYMFEGSDATQDIINGLCVSERCRLCREVWNFYVEAASAKKAEGTAEAEA